jgi:hypothetical protein
MHLSAGTLVTLYSGVYYGIYYAVKTASTMHPLLKPLICTPAILFLTLVPYWLDASEVLKVVLTVTGFFSGFNIVDLVYLEPVQDLSFKNFLFYVSTSTHPNQVEQVTKSDGKIAGTHYQSCAFHSC